MRWANSLVAQRRAQSARSSATLAPAAEATSFATGCAGPRAAAIDLAFLASQAVRPTSDGVKTTYPKLSEMCAACARVSYLTHDGRRDYAEDVALCGRLAESGHMSPLEHVAQAVPASSPVARCGNFRAGWHQLRKNFAQEYTR